MAADWEALKIEYATSGVGYRALAERHGLSASTLMKMGAREGWVEARARHRRAVVEKSIRRVEADKVDALVALQRSADRMAGVIERVVEDERQFYRHLVNAGRGPGEGGTVERIYDKVDTKALRDMVTAARDLTATVRNLYGLPTEAERASIELARERLELDKRKAAAGVPDEGEIGVIALPERGDAGP